MDNVTRQQIIDRAKEILAHDKSYSTSKAGQKIVLQDKAIFMACDEKGYSNSEFFAIETKKLNKFLAQL